MVEHTLDIEKLERMDSAFPSIKIAIDPGQPMFPAIVNDALRRLSTLPTGKLLLAAIKSASPKDDRGFKVLIVRVSKSYNTGLLRLPFDMLTSGRSYADAVRIDGGERSKAEVTSGEGASAIIGWCANQLMYTPKVGDAAARKPHDVPRCLSIGHELIHAMHTLQGTSKSGAEGIMVNEKTTSHEESFTVGLGPFAKDKITENALRSDLGMPARLSYP